MIFKTLKLVHLLTLLLYVAVIGVALFGAVVLIDGAAAQEQGWSNAPENESVETVDQWTGIVSKDYNPETGIATVEVYSDAAQDITLIDGSYLMRGTEMQSKSTTVPSGQVTELSIRAHEVDGYVMLSISTQNTAGRGVPIEVPTDYLPGEPGRGDPVAAGLGVGGAAAFIATAAYIFYRFYRGGVEHVL